MFESGIINHRQHAGLQKVSALVGMLHSSVGPDKKYKFIQDDTTKESVLVSSCFRIIENQEPTCAVGQLVYETLQAHHKVYHTGSGCLLFLAGVWSRAALDCLQKGIPVTRIISALSEGMDICMDVCKKSSISFEDFTVTAGRTAAPHGLELQLLKKSVTKASQVSCHMQGTEKTLNIGVQRKVKLSRHFCETKSDIVSTAPHPDQPELPDIAHIGQALSHGCDSSMKLAVEAVQIQWKTNQEMTHPTFDITKVVTCVLPGLPEDRACVVEGCIVLLSDEQASTAHQIKEQHLKVACIDGDLSHTYHHLGFKKPVGVHCVSEQLDLSGSGKEDQWLEKVVKLVSNLEVNLILTTGFACEKMIQYCFRHHILVVEKVNASMLRVIAKSAGAIPVTYCTQLNKDCVGSGVQVAIWKDLRSYERTSLTAVNISTGRNVGLVTVIVTSCVHGKLPALEDQFWACAYRLHYALKDRTLLPGAGVTEILCIQHLLKQAEHHNKKDSESVPQSETGTGTNLYDGVVLQLMADGLRDYITAVMVNTGRLSAVKARTVVRQQLQNFQKDLIISGKLSELFLENDKETSALFSRINPEAPSVKIYDNLSVKQEAWRKALGLVLLVLQSDAEVITSTNQKGEENLMLL